MKHDDTIKSTTQTFLDIYDIASDILIMKDGSASLILAVDAINFGLLAEEEQDAIMYSYAGLLNSLNYPIQIVIRSQTKDVSTYLHQLDEKANETISETRRKQITAYRGFVSNLIKERNVLDKKFYVVIPASALELGLVSAQSVIPGIKPKAAEGFEKTVVLDKALTNLHPKRDHLVSQFARIGLYARQLNTQEIIQLFYLSYNPEAAEGAQLSDTRSYTTPLVQTNRGIQGGIMSDPTTPKTVNPTPNADPSVPQAPAAADYTMPTPSAAPAPVTPTTPGTPNMDTSTISNPTPPAGAPMGTTPTPGMPVPPTGTAPTPPTPGSAMPNPTAAPTASATPATPGTPPADADADPVANSAQDAINSVAGDVK